jgi:RHS repeat-associated protein
VPDPEHLLRLALGAKRWNEWRENHPDVDPDLEDANQPHANLSGAFLTRVNFRKAYLRAANLVAADLTLASLTGANLSEACLRMADLRNANLSDADLRGADFSKANLSGAVLREANLEGADLHEANLPTADLSKAKLRRANLRGADLSGANLAGVDFQNADVRDADLSRTDLRGADLTVTDCSGTKLRGANLSHAKLGGTNLARADLNDAVLECATLVATDLRGANLAGCHVYGISAWELKLDGAIQSNLFISRESESAIQLDSLEVAQFMYLLLNNEKIRHFIDTITSKLVQRPDHLRLRVPALRHTLFPFLWLKSYLALCGKRGAGHDNAGNRLTKTDNRTSTTFNYAYDAIYQLLTVTQSKKTKETYTYDRVGNRLSSLGVSPYAYNSSNELTSYPGVTYTYDNNGNTKTKVGSSGTTTYNWDFENRLTSVVLAGSGGTVTFKYDPFGRRVQKSSTSGTTNYLYDGANLLEELDNSGNVLARYTQQPGSDQPLAQLRSGTTSYYEQDGVGSVTSLSNSAGAIANTYAYDSYGKLSASTGTLVNPFQYTGREFDAETGQYYYRARYFDQNVGRLLSEDPIRFRGGKDFYAYVLNNPLKYRDPSGRQGEVAGCVYEIDCIHSPDERAQMQREHDQMMQQILGLDPNLPEPGPRKPPNPPPAPSKCKQDHECVSAYVETALGGVAILGDVAFAWYVIPELFAESSLEGWEAIGHGVPTVAMVVSSRSFPWAYCQT